MKRQIDREAGFSLVELLIVLAIWGILTGIVSLAWPPLAERARSLVAAIEFRRVDNALSAYLLNGEAPSLTPRSEPAIIQDGDAPFTVYLKYLPTRYTYTWTGEGELTQHALAGTQGPKTPFGDTPQEISSGFVAVMKTYYEENGQFARSWSPYCYTDLGLDPDYWGQAIDGVRYKPVGEYLGLANVSGDEYQIYVDSTAGVTLHLVDGWNVWVSAKTDRAWFHKHPKGGSPESYIEVNLDTLQVVETS